jgi:hypothetical protein
VYAQHGLKGPLSNLFFFAYAEHTRKKLVRAEHTHQFLVRILKRMRSVHALVPDAYAHCTHQFLTRMLSMRISS